MADDSVDIDHGMEVDDSDWEYEYHETETESFYVTLDLSSATLSDRPIVQSNTSKTKSKAEVITNTKNDAPSTDLDAPNETTEQDEEVIQTVNEISEEDGDDVDGIDTIVSMSKSNSIPNNDNEAEPAPGSSHSMQILELHSPNPIISYRGQIYSCEWTSTIGTDVLLSTPDPNFPHPILKDEPGVSVLATTSIKLFGKPAKLLTNDDKEGTAAAPTASTTVADTTPAPAPALPKIPISATAKQTRQNQAKFLERLMAIKAAKGEKDEVTIYAQPAVRKSDRRKEQQEPKPDGNGDTEMIRDDESAPPTPVTPQGSTTGRSRSDRPRVYRPRRSRARGRTGLLFQDYRPPTSNADSVSLSSTTPSSWDQLPNNIVQPPVGSPFNTPPSAQQRTHHPPASRPNIDPPSIDRTKTDTVPNAPPNPDEANKIPDADPMPSSIPLTAVSAFEQRVSATEPGAGGPSPVGDEGRHSVAGGRDDGDGDPSGVGERGSGSDVEMGDA